MSRDSAEVDRESRRGFVSVEELLEPNFAIGIGLITHKEKAALEGRYVAQSDLLLGLIIPVSLLMCSVATRLSVRWYVYFGVVGLAIIASCVFFVLGMERRWRYRLELQSLIFGRVEKKVDDTRSE